MAKGITYNIDDPEKVVILERAQNGIIMTTFLEVDGINGEVFTDKELTEISGIVDPDDRPYKAAHGTEGEWVKVQVFLWRLLNQLGIEGAGYALKIQVTKKDEKKKGGTKQ